MPNIRIVVALVVACCLVVTVIEARKDEKSLKDGPTTGLMQYVDVVKYLYNHALSKADPASVRGLFTGPLSFLVYGASLLIGGIVLLAFYESPLSPLPVPPLPHPPVGRFPPEHSVWPANRIHRASNAPASNVARPSMANLQYPPINFAQHPSQFVSNPTQYHFAGSHLNPTLVEHPAQRNPSSASSNGNNSNAQRRASSNANASIQGRHQFAAPTQSSTLDSSNNSKGSSPQAASLQPASTSSESSHMIPVSGHKLSDSMQANPSLSPLNLLNLVNANHLLRRSEDTSSDTKQQQLVQAQLNQVQFGSSADLTHSDSQLNRS